ncbi:MAG: NrdH-redoxin [SAR202 cluster bacterium]|nr:NrdH-redoxin [SAR202 cluster bacterium]
MSGTIRMYGTEWCPDCWRSKRVFERLNIPFQWIDITRDHEAQQYVMEVNRGMRSVPTIVFPDGAILVEPSDSALIKKLAEMGFQEAAWVPRGR